LAYSNAGEMAKARVSLQRALALNLSPADAAEAQRALER
jgi:hypothetical protein